MKLLGDYHTHTVYSHGTGRVMDNALVAKEKGLEEIGISDHGFSHPLYGIKKSCLDFLRLECKEAQEKTGVRVLVGIESNFVNKSGGCDLSEDLYVKFDIFLAGAHVFVGYKDISTWWNVGVASPLVTAFGGKRGERARSFITNMYINAISSQPIDVLTHLDYRVFSNVKEVADCCRQFGTYVEINTKKTHMTDEQWREVYSTGVNFVIGSDAHSPNRVADIAPALELMERVGISPDRVHNLNGKPNFRFAKYKGTSL